MSQKFEWTEERIKTARDMWHDGAYIVAIAEAIGSTRFILQKFIALDRQTFPHRKKAHKPISHRIVKPIEAPAIKRVSHADRVVRVTEFGARVTLPRVTFIDGPAA